MGLARELARLRPNSSGLLPNTNIEAMAATKLTGTVPDANAPSGSVLQVVSTTKTDTFTTSSTSYVDISGLSVTITPLSTSSRILIITWLSTSGSDSYGAAFQLQRNGSAIGIADAAGSRVRASFKAFSASVNHTFMTGGTHLDSPNTTSAITYNVAMRVQNGATYNINRTGTDGDNSDAYHARSASGITVMEIAA